MELFEPCIKQVQRPAQVDGLKMKREIKYTLKRVKQHTGQVCEMCVPWYVRARSSVVSCTYSCKARKVFKALCETFN